MLGNYLESFILTGSAAIKGTYRLNNTAACNGAANELNGTWENDRLFGDLGNYTVTDFNIPR
jgi:hypothetical protein